jgi:simple sugar transport system permease protein
MGTLLGGRFLNLYNFQSLMFSAPELGLLSLAMMLSMLPGGIDLSLVAIANLSAILAALFFRFLATTLDVAVDELGIGFVVAGLALSAATGAVCGALNGIVITRLRVTPILATIGTSQLFLGISLVITGGPALQGYPTVWVALGNDTLLGVPVPVVVMIAGFTLVAWLLRNTAPGVALMLIGTNARAATFSAVRSRLVVFSTYIACGLIAGIAGILLSARTNAAKADFGTSYLLVAVLVAVLGGTNPAGGRGTVLGVAVALVALTLLSSGFQMLRFSNFLVELIWGAFLLIVLTIQYFRVRGFRAAAA